MKQKLLTANDMCEWSSLVNEHLSEGWHVVPGTIAISVTTSRAGTGETTIRAYAIVVEKAE